MFGPLSYISWGTKEAMSYINTLWQPTSKSMPEILCGVSSQFLCIRAEETDEPIIPTTTLIIREERCPGLRLLLWWNTRPKPTWERDAYLVHRFRSIIRVNQNRNLETGLILHVLLSLIYSAPQDHQPKGSNDEKQEWGWKRGGKVAIVVGASSPKILLILNCR